MLDPTEPIIAIELEVREPDSVVLKLAARGNPDFLIIPQKKRSLCFASLK